LPDDIYVRSDICNQPSLLKQSESRTFIIFKLDEDTDGTKDFFLDDLHFGLRIREDRRLNEKQLSLTFDRYPLKDNVPV
jgi:hypothetical protein